MYFYEQLLDILSSEDGSTITEQEMGQQLSQRLLLKHNFPLDAAQIKIRIATARSFAVLDEAQRSAVTQAHETWEANRTAFNEKQTTRRQQRAAARRATRHAATPAHSDEEFEDPEPTLNTRTPLQTAMLAANAAHQQQRGRFAREKEQQREAEEKAKKRRRAELRKGRQRAVTLETVAHLAQGSPQSASHLSSSSSAASLSSSPRADGSAGANSDSSSSSPAPSSGPRSKFVAAAVIGIYAQSMMMAAARQERMEQQLLEAIGRREEAERRREEAERRREEATAEYRARKLELLSRQRSTEIEQRRSEDSKDKQENEHPNTS